MRKLLSNFQDRVKEQTRAVGTSESSLTSEASISAAESQFSLLAASLGSIPVSVAFAYRDLPGFFFVASTYTINTVRGNKIFQGNW